LYKIKNDIFLDINLFLGSITIMFKNSCKILLMISIFVNYGAYALAPISYEDRLYYSRAEFAQDDDGKLLFKLRILGMHTSAKPTSVPQATNSSPITVGKLFSSGLGGDAATTFFFTNNIAAELSLGAIFVRSHNKALIAIANNYNGEAPAKGKNIYMFPMAVTAIYSIAPYGGIQPYVGVGGHATYVKSNTKNTKIKHGFGPVFQAGVDLVAKDYTLINFDIKYYGFTPRVSYTSPLVASNISSKIKLSPIVVSAGVGFKF
jgi:outer membrane protein